MSHRALFFFFISLFAFSAADGKAKKTKRFLSEAEGLERLASIEFHRSHQDSFLKGALYHPSKKVRKKAILTLGRVGDPLFLESLVPFLSDKSADIRNLAAFSMSLLGGDLALAMLTQHAQLDKSAASRGKLWLHTGRLGNEKTLKLYRNALNTETNRAVLNDICHGLSHLFHRSDPSWRLPNGLTQKLLELARLPEPLGYAAAFALSRNKGEAKDTHLPSLVISIDRAASSRAKALLVRAAGKHNDPKAREALVKQSKSTFRVVREEAAAAFGESSPDKPLLESAERLLKDKWNSVRVNVLDSITRWRERGAPLAPAVERLFMTSGSQWVKARALVALAAIAPKKATPHIEILMSQSQSALFDSAVRALGQLRTENSVERLFLLLVSPRTPAAAKAAESLSGLDPKIFTSARLELMKHALMRADVALTTVLAELAKEYQLKDLTSALVDTYALLIQRDHLEAKIAILEALATLKEKKGMEAVNLALKDPDRAVVLSALNTHQAIEGGFPKGFTPPLNSRSGGLSPSIEQVKKALKAKVRLDTRKGSIVLRMDSLAPLNAFNFVSLVEKKFFDGKTFHRVIPNFVTQGGDPRGDGFGGPGYFVRDEFSPEPHHRGSVGIATAGKDTGGSQFFFNLTDNLHLDGRYTRFAQVISGLGAMDRLEVGDVIIRARVTP